MIVSQDRDAFNREAPALFVRARELGLHTIAMSPFIRGWKLHEIGEDTAEVAAILLRWAEKELRLAAGIARHS